MALLLYTMLMGETGNKRTGYPLAHSRSCFLLILRGDLVRRMVHLPGRGGHRSTASLDSAYVLNDRSVHSLSPWHQSGEGCVLALSKPDLAPSRSFVGVGLSKEHQLRTVPVNSSVILPW